MLVTRREFLVTGSGAVASALFLGRTAWPKAKEEAVVFVYSVGASEGAMFFLSPDGSKRQELRTNLKNAHGYLAVKDAGKLLVLEKLGQKTAVVDIKKRKVDRYVSASPARKFYGHAAYSRRKKLWYASEADGMVSPGAIVVRDLSSDRPVAEFPSYGFEPHDLLVLEDQKLIVVQNGADLNRGPTNVVFVDIETGKKIREFGSPENDLAFGHLAHTDSGKIAISTQKFTARDPARVAALQNLLKKESDYAKQEEYRGELKDLMIPASSPLYLLDVSGKLDRADYSAAVEKSVAGFSIAVAGRFAAVTHEKTKSVGFYDIAKERLISAPVVNREGVSAVSALAGGDFVVVCHGAILRFHAPDFARVSKVEMDIWGPAHSIVI